MGDGGKQQRRECQRLFGIERGGELMTKVEEAIGEPCFCKRGLPCPLVPVPVEPAVPLQRVVVPERALEAG